MSSTRSRTTVVAGIVLALVAVAVALVLGRGGEATPAPVARPTEHSSPAVEDALVPAWTATLPAGPRVVRVTDEVVVLAGDRYLAGFERSSGDELWRRDLARWCTASDVTGTGLILLATGDPAGPRREPEPCRTVTAYDVRDGAERWSSRVPPFAANPGLDGLAVGDTAVTALGRCSVTRLRLDDGHRLSREVFELEKDGDCTFSGGAATDGQVLVDFVPDDPDSLDLTGTLRVRDADSGAVLRQEHGEDPVALEVLGGSPLVLGRWADDDVVVQRIGRRGAQNLLAGADTPSPALRSPGSTYATSAVDGGPTTVHRFDTATGTLAWSRSLQGTVVAADAAGLTVVKGEPGESYDVVRMAAADGQRQLLGRIARQGEQDRVLGADDVLVAVAASEDGARARVVELPPAGEEVGPVDDGSGSAAIGPDDVVGACNGFSDRTLAMLDGRRTEVGTRLDCSWYTVSTNDVNIRFETAVALGTPDQAEGLARLLPSAESFDDLDDLGESMPAVGWGAAAWVVDRPAARRADPSPKAPRDDNLAYALLVQQDGVMVTVAASVEVEREGVPGVVPAARVRRAVARAVTEIFASLGVEVTRP
ncbi:PQQ-binding-like beta-propeller repeat protein [Nocardioides sp. QY071]|uniref:outer membrane protein assembly factor BamB family protein n=1 Tax=Nocardioides sp. QY071 TaxID=3044187 RepID=UPI00249BC2E2|nr:PQQ-binding-like beta-propeller repeat protein [Nocardioides sp. QY071]WGY03210.1 PQQ-binding-like beta-propeller repeat protein [Nocardioides sp. QY071]